MPLRCKLMAIASTVASLLVAPWPSTGHAADEACVDVAIVLAVDGSGSVNTREFLLQQQAIVSALRDPEVLRTMNRAGSVAAAVLYWGDANWPVQETPFVHIQGRSDVETLVSALLRMPRRVFGNTGLSMGLSAALDKLVTVRCSRRSVINVSGDGSDTIISRRKRFAPTLKEIRSRAELADVTINALIISNEERDLKAYFEKQVITGPGAFVMEIRDFSDYAEALRRKLIREIAPMTLSQMHDMKSNGHDDQ